ncbi:hypothetical protein [Tardiphaga sp. 803_E3_N1_3]|uniref:hypothetical protein n=1 Tax=Tardiphaga sp. 803_E3_N1_3 TaxID=3240785 RepID=UPI003F2750B1
MRSLPLKWVLSNKRWADFVFVGALLVLGLAIFFPFRVAPISNPTLAWALATGMLVAIVLWALISNPFAAPGLRACSAAELLGACSVVGLVTLCIFLPLMLIRFDTGTDTSVGLGARGFWEGQWAALNRPLVGAGFYLALLITPGSITGLFVVAVIARFTTGVVLYLMVKCIYPGNRFVPLAAAVLYVLNPVELGRFNLWSVWYLIPVTTLVGSFYLFLRSYLMASRVQLVGACLLLGVTFLHYEHGYPLAAAFPILIFMLPRVAHRSLWLIAWFGTLAIFALRMGSYLYIVQNSYQKMLIVNWSKPPDTVVGYILLVVNNAQLQIAPFFTRWLELRPLSMPLLIASITAGVAALLIMFCWTKRGATDGRLKPLAIATTIAFVAAILGVVVYLPLPVTTFVPDYGTNPTLRYQFFSAPGQAVFWAFLISLVGSLLPFALRKIGTAVLFAVTVAAATAIGAGLQQSGGVLNSYYEWNTALKVLRDVGGSLPPHQPGDVIFFDLPASDRSPLGWDYTGFHWSCILFGVPAFQGSYLGNGRAKLRVFSYPNGTESEPPSCKRMHRFDVREKGTAVFVATEEMVTKDTGTSCSCVIQQQSKTSNGDLPFIGK